MQTLWSGKCYKIYRKDVMEDLDYNSVKIKFNKTIKPFPTVGKYRKNSPVYGFYIFMHTVSVFMHIFFGISRISSYISQQI